MFLMVRCNSRLSERSVVTVGHRELALAG